MDDLINIPDLEAAIVSAANDRYHFSNESDNVNLLLSIAPDVFLDSRVLQLKRNNNETNNWRTILLTSIPTIDQFDKVLRWTADVRDELLDPEAADLYLILMIKDTEVSLDICTNIESDDKYCRKYIFRPHESIEGLLSRTFLNTLTSEASEEEIVDPLHTALNKTSRNITWLTPKLQNYWKAAFLSNKTSSDLIENLFTDNSSLTEDDESFTEDNDQ